MTADELRMLPAGQGAASSTGYRLWWLGWGDNYGLLLSTGPAVLVDDTGAAAMLGAGTWTVGHTRRRIDR